jgi:hypothetical protein
MSETPSFADPHHCPIVHSDGPINVSQIQGTTVLSFTQIIPKLDHRLVGQASPMAGGDIEMLVVARVGIPIAKVSELIDILQKIVTASTSAGHA